MCRDISLGSGGEVGDCVSHCFLVNHRRGESALNGVGLEGVHQHCLLSIGVKTPYLVNDIRLDPYASEGCRDDRDVRLCDKVREDLLDRVGHGQSCRLDQKTGSGEGDRQSLSFGEDEGISLGIGDC